jgi:hypothetical protein
MRRAGQPPSEHADPHLLAAFSEIAERIARSLSLPAGGPPIRMFVAGGVAVHYYTGVRPTRDVDAVFSHKVLLPADLDVNYLDANGTPRLLYFDRQYNDTFGLLHEDANDDSVSIRLHGVDASKLDVRLLSPLDVAVSKLARFENHDRTDILALAKAGLITGRQLRKRAEEALAAYVGNIAGVRVSLDLACQLIAEVEAGKRGRAPAKPGRRR